MQSSMAKAANVGAFLRAPTIMKTRFTRKLKYHKTILKLVGTDLWSFLRNLILAVVMGICVGAYSTLFALLINWATAFRLEHMWLIFFLPAGGIAIVALYHICGVKNPRGTNRVLESISKEETLPIMMAPLITVASAITHFFGGSAGREGAALQIGGSMGRELGVLCRLDKKNITVMTLCGMSAAFSAMFGTPLTATIFAMEVVSIGIMHYSAIVPCAAASLTASLIAKAIGLSSETYSVTFPDLTWLSGLETLGLGVVCALVSSIFCLMLHKTEHLYHKYFENQYIRAVAGGFFVILLTMMAGTGDFNGTGTHVIAGALAGNALPYAFILKMIFTAVTLGAGFKGGEIVPTLFVGATFGCVFGPLIGIPAAAGAALGVCGVFCGVTNCPIASIALAFELFGAEGLPLYLIVVAVSYRLSGYYSLYSGQKIMYSKSVPLFVNRKTKE